ncbi:MAG TPA: hypothetical protein VJ939_04500 [Bacteroidales bacterium]|nr:hypothetical protein [Bacteroidales bacterium]
MRHLKVISILAVVIILTATACEENNRNENNSPEGTYIGSLSRAEGNTPAKNIADEPTEATAVVEVIGDRQMEAHWTGHGIDTTMMLNYYDHQDSVLVCLTGNEFENQYGHMLGEGHMEGGHMSDMHDGETEWMHHMNDEHDPGDEHFGGFDMQDHTFTYRFEIMDEDTPVTLVFQGEKTK